MNYEQLVNGIVAVIKENGNEEITGNILQEALVAIVSTLGSGYQFMGLAYTTDAPEPGDRRVCYIAAEVGEYPGFDGMVAEEKKLTIFMYDINWRKIEISLYVKDEITGVVRYDDSQILSAYEKSTARANISAASASEVNALTQRVSATDQKIADVIPEEATSTNKLITQAEVDSKIAFNTANYISDNGQPFTSVEALEAYPKEQLTNNDYAVVVGVDSEGHNTYTYYVYNFDTEKWAKEFVIDTFLTPFTDVQMAALNSGITAALVAKIATAEQTADKVSDIDNVPVEAESQKYPNIGAVRRFVNSNKQLFVAEYDVTTVQEIMDAYNAGKLVVCLGIYSNIPCVYSQMTFISKYIMFYGHAGSLLDAVYVRINTETGEWNRSRSIAEASTNKKTTIDPASDTDFPTSKAVASYVASLEWDGTQAEYDALTVKNPNVTYFIHE